jgi:hypothetical protein
MMNPMDLLHRSPYDAWRWAEDQFTQRDYIGSARTLEALLENPEVDASYRSQVHELLARAYYHSARLAPAATAAREALEADPANGYMALLLSRTLERQNDAEGAERYRRRAEALGVDA